MQKSLSNWAIPLLLVSATFFAAVPAAASNSEVQLGIKGYSPVSYFENNRAEPGDPRFSTVHNQRQYLFTSAEQLARFEADPTKYEPVFPDHCPYNLALGRAAAIDPYNFKIVDGNLLLFHRTEEMDGREAWEEHANDEELLERAQATYTLFRF